MDETNRQALTLIAEHAQNPAARTSAAGMLAAKVYNRDAGRTVGLLALNETHWSNESLLLIAALIAGKPGTRGATLPAVRCTLEQRARAEELAARHGLSLAEWIRHRATSADIEEIS